MAAPDLVVVGGGISGLSLACFAAGAGRKVLVLERGASLGGCVQTERLADGFWFELGAHTGYNSYGEFLGVLERRGALGRLRPRRKVPFRLLVDGTVTPIQKQLHLLELLGHAPRLLWTRKDGLSVEQYYGRIVGRRNYARVFGPLFAAVPSQPADAFPAQMLFKKRARRKDVLRSFTMDGGLQSFTDLLAATEGVQARTSAEVVSLARGTGGFTVTLAGGERIDAPAVALATPPPVAAQLLETAVPAAAAALAQIRTTRIKTVGAAVPRDATGLEPFAGLIPLDGRFYSIVSRDTVPDERHRGFAVHLKPDVPTDQAFEQLAGVLGTEPGRFEATATREVTLPSPVVGHDGLVRAVQEAIAGERLFVVGNYFGGLALEDCVLRARAEAQRLAATPRD